MNDWRIVDQSEPLPDEEFWQLIDLINNAVPKSEHADISFLRKALTNFSETKIAAFDETLAQKAYALDTRKHYKAFSWFPGLSDTFFYARLGVIGLGVTFYEDVLSSPKKFPRRGTIDLEELLVVAREAYEEKTGYLMDYTPSKSPESFSNMLGWAK